MTSLNELFGQDIALDDAWQALVAANGEFVLTEGVETALQGIKLRLCTYLGTLFYDENYGSKVPDWIMEENDELTRISFVAEVKRCMNSEPSAKPGSSICSIRSWDETGIEAELEFQLIDSDHTYNLVIYADHSTKEMVIKDANPAVI